MPYRICALSCHSSADRSVPWSLWGMTVSHAPVFLIRSRRFVTALPASPTISPTFAFSASVLSFLASVPAL